MEKVHLPKNIIPPPPHFENSRMLQSTTFHLKVGEFWKLPFTKNCQIHDVLIPQSTPKQHLQVQSVGYDSSTIFWSARPSEDQL